MTATTTTPFEPGTKVRLRADTLNLNDCTDSYPLRAGTEFVVEDHVSADDAEDGVAFYYGSSPSGYNDIAVPDDKVELVLTVAQMGARTLPTAKDILRAVASTLGGLDEDTFTTDDADVDDTNQQVEIAGETEQGLRFSFIVTVGDPQYADF